MPSLPQLALTFLVDIYWQNILELLQAYDSNPLNSKELMHQAGLHMIKLNVPTHEFEKSDIWRQGKNTMFSRIYKKR
jgi:hypothetical protein